MSKKKKADKANADADRNSGFGYYPDLTAEKPVWHDHFLNGAILADECIESVFRNINHHIYITETLKKMPDYNSNVAVELAVICAKMKIF